MAGLRERRNESALDTSQVGHCTGVTIIIIRRFYRHYDPSASQGEKSTFPGNLLHV